MVAANHVEHPAAEPCNKYTGCPTILKRSKAWQTLQFGSKTSAELHRQNLKASTGYCTVQGSLWHCARMFARAFPSDDQRGHTEGIIVPVVGDSNA